MRIKADLFDSLMDLIVLRTGESRTRIYQKHGFSNELVSKARKGGSLSPRTIYRLAGMAGCDPFELVAEEDLPKPVANSKRSKAGK